MAAHTRCGVPADPNHRWTSRAIRRRSQCDLSARQALRRVACDKDLTGHISRMTVFLTILLVLAMLGTLTVLGFGVASLLRGDPRRSNKLMQSRVIMQALALVLLAMLMLLARH